METADQIVAQYTPRSMIPMLQQSPMPSTFLLDQLVSDTITHDTDIVQIDVEKEGDTVAAYVSRSGDATIVGKNNYDSNIHAIPYIYEEIPFTAKDLRVRMPGEMVIGGMAPRERMDEKVFNWMNTLRRRFLRREELQLAQALQTGIVPVVGQGVSYDVNLQMDSNHLITNSGSDNWTPTSTNIISQLEDVAQLIRDKGAPPVTDLYLGSNAARIFRQNEEVLELMDNRRVEMGSINPQQLSDQKATFLGTLSAVGLNINVYAYTATYHDGTSRVPYVGTNNAILTSRNVRVTKHYGMIENLHHGSFRGEQFPDLIIDPNGRHGSATLESGPLVAVHQPDGVARITVTDA